MNPVRMHPWRQSPFVVGHRYRIRRDFQAQRDSFRAGEVLIYDRDAYSRYDGCTGYFFSQLGAPRLRSWDIHDEADLTIWQELFEAMPGDETHGV